MSSSKSRFAIFDHEPLIYAVSRGLAPPSKPLVSSLPTHAFGNRAAHDVMRMVLENRAPRFRNALRLVACAAAASLVLGWAPAARAQTTPPDDARPGARFLIWTGATVFSATYIASAIGATTAYDDDASTTTSRGLLWIPAAGPFLLMGSTHGLGWDALLALDGVAQIGGLTVFGFGVALKHSNPPARAASPVTLSIAPTVSRGVSGASLVGTF